ncbi:acyltransferase family protein [Kibdelosporangium phytohabitans]|nr:acyltransferase [Kibdelosporangium phytohabitans]MBE1464627.1 mycarose O-acyltransferase [Kibdelosporangium phytohabitans]
MSELSGLPAQGTTRRPTLPSLTGMRFIAAFSVFALGCVYYLFASPDPIVFEGSWHAAAGGVSYFFILSGFILAWSAPAGDTNRRFWRRRFFKIYPNHLITFVVAVVLIALMAPEAAVDSWIAIPNLLLIQSWFPGLDVRGSFNGVAWSLSCEALFYFCFPFLQRLVDRIRPTALWWWAGGVVAVIFAIPALSAAIGPVQEPLSPILGLTAWDSYVVYQLPPVRMLEFVFGIILARIVMNGQRLPLGFGGAVVLVIAAFALKPIIPPAYATVAITVVPLGLLVAAGAVADNTKKRTGLANRVMVWLGEISFALYMWHYMVLLVGYHLLIEGKGLSTAATIGIAVGLFGISIVVSWLQYTMIERPIMRKFARPRQPAPAPKQPAAA